MSDFNPQAFVDNYTGNLMPSTSSLRNADDHQVRVSAFCEECAQHAHQQHVNHEITNKLTREQAVLRAILQLEEMFELIRGLGVSVRLKPETDRDADLTVPKSTTDLLDFKADGTVNLTEIIDGLVDDSVISSGTASLLGIPIAAFTEVVDYNNIAKFAPGHHFREDGKLVKPEGHPKPDLAEVVKRISGKDLDTDFAPYNWSEVE